MRPPSRQSRWHKFVFFYGIILTFLTAVVFIYQPSFLSLVSQKVYDSMLRSLPEDSGSNLPVIVDLDEKTLAEFGQWPWPRYRVALLLDKINMMSPSIIGLDMLFAEPDRTSLDVVQKELQRDLNITVSFNADVQLENNDQLLALSMAEAPVILGYNFFFDDIKSSVQPFLHPIEVIIRHDASFTGFPSLFEAQNVTANLPVLSSAVKSSGFLNYPADADGVLRRVPLVMTYQDRIYPSLALAAAMRELQVEKLFVEMEGNMVESLRLGERQIPVDSRGNLLVRFQRHTGGFDYISAADILNDTIDKDRLKNKIAFVGTSAAGLQDTHPTPLDPHFPGVEVHATIVGNILNDQFLKIPAWSAGLEFVSVIVCGVISALILTWSGPLISIIFLTLGGIFLWYGSFLLLSAKTIFINPFFALLILLINFSFLSLLKFWREERRLKKRTRELLLAQDTTILSMSSLAETRDNETGGHIMRTQHYIKALAKHLALLPKFSKVLDPVVIETLYRSTPLHDIGKVGVADHILLNPGKLTSEEFEEMKKHPRYGYDTLVRAESRLKNEGGHSFLRLAREIAYHHHEKWDGTGYPQGLAGTDIPLSGRMMALADVYDALISRRRYKPAFPHEVAVEIIKRGSGTHFDPDLVEAFVELEDTFREIAGKYGDNEVLLRSEEEFSRYANITTENN